MNKKKKVFIAHPFQQHSFRLAEALSNNEFDYKYFTTVYNKDKSITGRISKLLSKEDKVRVEARKSKLVPDFKVIQIAEIWNLVTIFFTRSRILKLFSNYFYNYTIKRFNKKLYKYILKDRPDIVILYDVLSGPLVKKIKQNLPDIKVIIDMSAAYVELKYQEYLTRTNKKLTMIDYGFDKRTIKYGVLEKDYADYFLVASQYSLSSLTKFGADINKIFTIPYGYSDVPDVNIKIINKNEKKICAFIGRPTYIKGFYDFLYLVDNNKNENIEFRVYGSIDKSTMIFKNYSQKINFRGHINKASLMREYRDIDIVIYPSYSDGFGLVIIESLLSNVPVIASRNAGASELIIDNYNGFSYNSGDKETLSGIFNNLLSDDLTLTRLKENSRSSIINCTWENYYKKIREMIRTI